MDEVKEEAGKGEIEAKLGNKKRKKKRNMLQRRGKSKLD